MKNVDYRKKWELSKKLPGEIGRESAGLLCSALLSLIDGICNANL
jgi:hypothetical protein